MSFDRDFFENGGDPWVLTDVNSPVDMHVDNGDLASITFQDDLVATLHVNDAQGEQRCGWGDVLLFLVQDDRYVTSRNGGSVFDRLSPSDQMLRGLIRNSLGFDVPIHIVGYETAEGKRTVHCDVNQYTRHPRPNSSIEPPLNPPRTKQDDGDWSGDPP